MALREKVEVVEVSSHLSGRLVVGRDLPTLYSGHLFGERGLLNASGQPKLLPYALTLTYLLLQTHSPQFCAHRSHAPLFGDLTLHYAVDDDSPVGQLSAGGCNAHELPSIVDGVHDEAGHHLVVPGYLILDDQATRGERGMKSSDPPQVILSIGFLAGNQFIVVDEVGGQHLVHGVQVSLDYSCLHETASQCSVFFCRHRSSPLCQLAFLYWVDTMSMMPLSEASRTEALLTGVRGRGILRTSPRPGSGKFFWRRQRTIVSPSLGRVVEYRRARPPVSPPPGPPGFFVRPFVPARVEMARKVHGRGPDLLRQCATEAGGRT